MVEINWTTGMNREANAAKVSDYADAGITWWSESLYTMRDSPERMLSRIRRTSEARECSVEGEAHPKASGVRARLGHANHRDPEKLMTIRRGMGRRAKRRLVPNRTD